MAIYKNPDIKLPDEKISAEQDIKIQKEYRLIDPAYFVFMDMLGFKATFNTNSDINRNIKNVFEYFNSLIDQMRCITENSETCYAGQTSDSLYFYTSNKFYLIYFINVFLHFNAYAMSKNVFFRGGIAKGTLYVNKPHQFYGDCVINSYLLEEEISNYPRITIDDKTMKDIKSFMQSECFEEDKNRNYLKPFSRIIFKDISEDLNVTNADFHTIDIKLIRKIRSNILKNKKKYEFHNRNYQKYVYLLKNCEDMIENYKNN